MRTDYNIMEEAIDLVTENHNEVEAQGWKKELRSFLEENAVRGMLRALDPHSTLFTSEELEQWNYDLNPTYSGIGSYVEMDETDQRLILTQPMFGGPAYRAGFEPGDKVIKIDGWEAQGKVVEDITSRLKGPSGSTVDVEIYRKGWRRRARSRSCARRSTSRPSSGACCRDKSATPCSRPSARTPPTSCKARSNRSRRPA